LWIEDFLRRAVYLPKKVIERSGAPTPVGRIHRDVQGTPRRALARQQELMLDLDEIARAGARRMLAQALEAEVEAYLMRPKISVTKEATPWLFVMGVLRGVRYSWEREP